MIREQNPQTELEFVSIDEMVPEDHLLRKISSSIEFEFIREKTKDLYSPNRGRPAIDPVVLFKTMMIGYLYGIRSERRLVKEIEVNVAYRWFLGLRLNEKVMHHSTLSQNRIRRFKENGIYKEIFDEIINQAIKRNMVGGETLYTDSTHIKASANKKRYKKRTVKKSTKKYLDELDKAIEEDRKKHGKKPLAKKEKEEEKLKYESTTDPESGNMRRDGKPKGFYYLDHRTTDDKFNIIVDSYVTPANINDSEPYLDRLEYLIEKHKWEINRVGLDAGYYTPWICKNLVEKGIFGAIGYKRPSGKKDNIPRRFYQYNEEKDCIICPEEHELRYSTTNRDGQREYHSNPKVCINCPKLKTCTQSKDHKRIIMRHVWEEYKERITANRKTDEGKVLMGRRKEKVEISFANAKILHNHREAMRRGIQNVQEQAYLSAACQNMKSIALFMLIFLKKLLFGSINAPQKQNKPQFQLILQNSN